MPERIEKLRSTLKELEEELGNLSSFDEATRQMLEEAATEIKTALRKEGQFESESVVERLRTAEEKFQASHPTLSGVVGRIIDALGQLGI